MQGRKYSIIIIQTYSEHGFYFLQQYRTSNCYDYDMYSIIIRRFIIDHFFKVILTSSMVVLGISSEPSSTWRYNSSTKPIIFFLLDVMFPCLFFGFIISVFPTLRFHRKTHAIVSYIVWYENWLHLKNKSYKNKVYFNRKFQISRLFNINRKLIYQFILRIFYQL